MRTAVILPRKYEGKLIYEAQKCGLAKKIDLPTPNALTNEQEESVNKYLYSKLHVIKQKIFRMVLLFDEIIIPGIDPTNDYTGLEASGFFDFSTIDEYIQYGQKHNLYEDCVATSDYLKPALLPVLRKRLSSYYDNDIKDLSKAKFAENIYDTFFTEVESGGSVQTPKMRKAMQIARDRYSLSQKTLSVQQNMSDADRAIFSKFSTLDALLSGEIAYEYEYLNMLLDLSNERSANIVNCEYQLAKIGCSDSDMSIMLDNYATIKVECKNMIGALPKLNSLLEVIDFKNKKRKEIARLRNVLSEFEDIVRTSGRDVAIKNIKHDAELAVRDLNRNISTLAKIGCWTTILSVPITIAESMLHIPPVIGLPVGILGTGSLISSIVTKKKRVD